MKYLVIGALVAGALFGLTAAIVQIQSVEAADAIIPGCMYILGGCIPDSTNQTKWIPAWLWYHLTGKGSGISELLDWDRILSLPENQSFSVSVKHGPAVDTVIIQIPKALSSPSAPNMWTPQNMTALNMTKSK